MDVLATTSTKPQAVSTTYIIPRNRLLRCHGIKETIHRLLQLCAVMGDFGLEVQRVQRHAEFFSQSPESGQADGAGIEMVLFV